ncbi:retrovirus-related Pol polyprotein from transposon 17.6 [Trichonephila clavipes]|nr:retrovirus-related Pol polyprotein from transposon 17.6 [Trichonephila clavipes]
MDDLLQEAKHTAGISTIDLKSGYHQVNVHPADRDKTAFVCQFGTYRFKRMPFGLKLDQKYLEKRKFYGNRFTKLALNSNNTSASEAKLSASDSFDVPEPEFHDSTGNRIINFLALMGIISILCCPECYATGLKLWQKILRKDFALICVRLELWVHDWLYFYS